jgi:hypothetical protein
LDAPRSLFGVLDEHGVVARSPNSTSSVLAAIREAFVKVKELV